MRKLVLSITAVLGLTLSAYGQVYAGGAIGTSKIGGSKSVNVVPEAGYYINEHNAVSLSLGYSTYIDTDADITTHTLCVMPCYSYAIPLEGKWKIDAKASLGYSRFFRPCMNRLGIYIGPQLEYYIRPQWTIWCGFDALALEVEWRDGRKANIDFNWFNTGINFGFYYYVK